jgi:hypothetical protein
MSALSLAYVIWNESWYEGVTAACNKIEHTIINYYFCHSVYMYEKFKAAFVRR